MLRFQNRTDMDTDLIIMKAQFGALRNLLLSILPTFFEHDKNAAEKTWLAKFCLWRFERENLVPYSSLANRNSPETEQIDRRRFQLQILMDVAYIRGHLEEYGILHGISRHSADFANRIYESSDGTEASMISLIDKT